VAADAASRARPVLNLLAYDLIVILGPLSGANLPGADLKSMQSRLDGVAFKLR
jgi:hypothetical protein